MLSEHRHFDSIAGSKQQEAEEYINLHGVWHDGITANSEKVMQGHLNGKVHKRKVVALPELPKIYSARDGEGERARGRGRRGTGTDEVQDNSSNSTKANVEVGLVPSAVPQAHTAADKEEESALSLGTPETKNTVAMALASMAVDADQPAEAQLDTCIMEPAVDCEILLRKLKESTQLLAPMAP